MVRFSCVAVLVQALFLSGNAFQTRLQGPLVTPPSVSVGHSASRLSMAADPEAKKETTWDRITGPKLFKTVTNWNGIHSVPLVPLRILTGMLMIHHGSEGACMMDVSSTKLIPNPVNAGIVLSMNERVSVFCKNSSKKIWFTSPLFHDGNTSRCQTHVRAI